MTGAQQSPFKRLTFWVLFLSRKKVQINSNQYYITLLFEACSFYIDILLLLAILLSSFCLIKKKQKIKPLSMRLLRTGFRFAPCSFSSAVCLCCLILYHILVFYYRYFPASETHLRTFHLSRTKALYCAIGVKASPSNRFIVHVLIARWQSGVEASVSNAPLLYTLKIYLES